MGEIDIVNVVETSPGSSEDEMEPGKEIFKATEFIVFF